MKPKKKQLLLIIILLLAVGGAVVMLNTMVPDGTEKQKEATIKEDGFLLLEEEKEITKTQAYDNAIQDSYNSDEINLDLDNMFDDVEEKKEEEKPKDSVPEETIPIFDPEESMTDFSTQSESEEKPEPVQTYTPKPKVVHSKPTQVKSEPVAVKEKEVETRTSHRQERSGFYGSKSIELRKPDEYRANYETMEGETKEQNRLHCAVFNDQSITNGSRVTFRALEDFEFRGEKFPKNTLLYGTANFKENRIVVDITQASISQKVVAVQMNLFDQDGGKGIYSSELSQIKKATERKGQSTASKLVNGLAGSLSGGYVNGVGDIITSSGDGNKKVELYDGYDVYAVF